MSAFGDAPRFTIVTIGNTNRAVLLFAVSSQRAID